MTDDVRTEAERQLERNRVLIEHAREEAARRREVTEQAQRSLRRAQQLIRKAVAAR
jgi:hypothetical protein